MLDGCITVNPYEKGTSDACTYCAYRKVCGFDPSLPGYEKRMLDNLSKDEIMEQMKQQSTGEIER